MNPDDPIQLTKEEVEIEGGRTLILYEFEIADQAEDDSSNSSASEPER